MGVLIMVIGITSTGIWISRVSYRDISGQQVRLARSRSPSHREEIRRQVERHEASTLPLLPGRVGGPARTLRSLTSPGGRSEPPLDAAHIGRDELCLGPVAQHQ